MKKNNTFGILLGLLLIYVGINGILSHSSDNTSLKEFTYINKAMAKLDFYQDDGLLTPYYKTKDDLVGKKWSSENHPNSQYSKVYVDFAAEPSVVPEPITYIVILPITTSH